MRQSHGYRSRACRSPGYQLKLGRGKGERSHTEGAGSARAYTSPPKVKRPPAREDAFDADAGVERATRASSRHEDCQRGPWGHRRGNDSSPRKPAADNGRTTRCCWIASQMLLLSYCCLSATSFLVTSRTTIGSEMPRRQSAPFASGSTPSPSFDA